jgi:hypothetical protein
MRMRASRQASSVIHVPANDAAGEVWRRFERTCGVDITVMNATTLVAWCLAIHGRSPRKYPCLCFGLKLRAPSYGRSDRATRKPIVFILV